MENKIKIRNLKAESKYLFLMNTIIVTLLAVFVFFIYPYSSEIGIRNTGALEIISVVSLVFFMRVLEKYSILISGLYEKILITVLSSGFTFVILSMINLCFFRSPERLFYDILFAILAVILLGLADFIAELIHKNKKIFKNPSLLIIDSEEKNFLRMKRMKYGVLKKYDSWYEQIDENLSENELKEYCLKRFKEFHAICILDGVSDEEYSVLVKAAVEMNKELFIVPKIIDVGKTNAKIVRFDDVLTLYMPENYITEAEHLVKRITDIVIASVGFIVALIPMIIIAIAIKLTSRGPVFYKQERLTKNKKSFMIYKFRTMVPDAEKLTGPKFAEKDDPRITKVGKILRACRLDELPQILNILKGDMSVVGPRPERPVFVEEFEKEIENYDYRFAVKAGLTSLSHVYGRYSTYIHDRTYYDLFYITNYSYWLDLKIILLTAKTMFLKSAAEGEDEYKEKTVSQNPEEEAVK